MPRIPRGQLPGLAYHVLNRGNGRATVFHKDADYRAFCDLLSVAKKKFSVSLLGFCVLPNHFHLLLQPHTPNALSAMMQWWLTSHVRRYHRHYHGSGHVWQGRFKSFPIQQDAHLLTVLRYVLLNPVRAGLVTRADPRPWSSLIPRIRPIRGRLPHPRIGPCAGSPRRCPRRRSPRSAPA